MAKLESPRQRTTLSLALAVILLVLAAYLIFVRPPGVVEDEIAEIEEDTQPVVEETRPIAEAEPELSDPIGEGADSSELASADGTSDDTVELDSVPSRIDDEALPDQDSSAASIDGGLAEPTTSETGLMPTESLAGATSVSDDGGTTLETELSESQTGQAGQVEVDPDESVPGQDDLIADTETEAESSGQGVPTPSESDTLVNLIKKETVSSGEQEAAETDSVTTPAEQMDTADADSVTTPTEQMDTADADSVTTPTEQMDTAEADSVTTPTEQMDTAEADSVTTPTEQMDTAEADGVTTPTEQMDTAEADSVTTPTEQMDTAEADSVTTPTEQMDTAEADGVTTPTEQIDTAEADGVTTPTEQIDTAEADGVTTPTEQIDTAEADGMTTPTEQMDTADADGMTTPAEQIDTAEVDGVTTPTEQVDTAEFDGATTPAEQVDSAEVDGVTTPTEQMDTAEADSVTTPTEQVDTAEFDGVTTPTEQMDTVEADGTTTPDEQVDTAEADGVTTPTEQMDTAEVDGVTTPTEQVDTAEADDATMPAEQVDIAETDGAKTDLLAGTTSVESGSETVSVLEGQVDPENKAKADGDKLSSDVSKACPETEGTKVPESTLVEAGERMECPVILPEVSKVQQPGQAEYETTEKVKVADDDQRAVGLGTEELATEDSIKNAQGPGALDSPSIVVPMEGQPDTQTDISSVDQDMILDEGLKEESSDPSSTQAVRKDSGALQGTKQLEGQGEGSQVSGLKPTEELPERMLPPTFDLVRVDQYGTTVVAGRTSPKVPVETLVNSKVFEEGIADSRGQFTQIFAINEAKTPAEIRLAALTSNGSRIYSAESVIVIPPPGGSWVGSGESSGTLVADTDGTGSTVGEEGLRTVSVSPIVLLTKEDRVELMAPFTSEEGSELSKPMLIELISYDQDGQAVLSGSGTPEGMARIYIDNAPLGSEYIDEKGKWSTTLDSLDAGIHSLRVDELDEKGEFVSSVETPFKKEVDEFAKEIISRYQETGKAGSVPNVDTATATLVTVQRGYTLWGISRSHYGLGRLYVRIYHANIGQIDDPDLIYPGQLFVVPGSSSSSLPLK